MLDEYMRLQSTTNDHQIRAVLVFKGHINDDLLARAAEAVMQAIPLARCAFTVTEGKRRWEPRGFTGTDCVHVAESSDGLAELDRYLAETAPDSGPQLRLQVLRETARDTLIVTVNHLLADGTGFKTVLYALAEAYRTGTCASFPANRSLDLALKGAGTRARLNALFRRQPRKFPVVPLGPGDETSKERLFRIEIPEDDFAALRKRGKEAGATINDLVIAAIVTSLSTDPMRERPKAVTVQCMIDLRRYASDRSQIGVANFASMESLTIPAGNRDARQILDEVTRITARMKAGSPGLRDMMLLGIAYKIFPAKLFDAVIGGVIRNVTTSTTNLGELDGERLDFGAAHAEETALDDAFFVTSVKREPAFQLTISTYRSRLNLTALGRYSDDNARKISGIVARVKRALTELSGVED
jgi:NRPS condensation-like uncharacterized protein